MSVADLGRRVRFAPSPTGSLHLGTARVAIINLLFARANNGELVLRFDDTDKERSDQELEVELRNDLAWLGLTDFAETVRQSERDDLYAEALEVLKASDCVYLDDGAWYFRVPHSDVVFTDTIRGEIRVPPGGVKDFVVLRSDGTATYNFATAVDDLRMEISCVIRGEDHIANTSLQTLVIKALGGDLPTYLHLPLLLGSDGAKLSKRHGATSVREYRDAGYLAEAIFNYLAITTFSVGTDEVLARDQLIEAFAPDSLHRSPAHFDIDKLRWLNGRHIRALPLGSFAERISPWITTSDPGEALLQAMQTAGATLAECAEVEKLVTDRLPPNLDAQTALSSDDAQKAVDVLAELLPDKNIDLGAATELLKRYKKDMKAIGIEIKTAMHAVRAALTGATQGPELNKLLAALPIQEIKIRLQRTS